MIKNFFTYLAFSLAFWGGSNAIAKPTVWIYTSVYPDSLQVFDAVLKEKFPDYDIQWFQNGSENVHAKIAIERLSKNVQADLVLTADLAWYKKMAAEGFFENYVVSVPYEIPASFRATDGAYTAPRLGAVVIGYNKKLVSDTDAPKSFSELTDPKWKGKISSGSPLESGSQYTLMMNLVYKYGYDFLKSLRQNDIVAAGGNSAVMKRLVTGEKPVGLVLLENLLNEQKKNPDIGIVYPSDGVIFTPGPMAIVKKEGRDSVPVKKIYDFFLSDTAQKIFTGGYLYVFDKNVPAPTGAKPLEELQQGAFDTSDAFYDFMLREDAAFKQKFADIILN